MRKLLPLERDKTNLARVAGLQNRHRTLQTFATADADAAARAASKSGDATSGSGAGRGAPVFLNGPPAWFCER